MADEMPFAEFLARIRAGDAAAAEELIRRYEPTIRVAVRTHLTSSALRRQFDSMDICQSVMLSFFARTALGQYDLADPKELLGLLIRMTRNKLASQVRRHSRDCRDVRRVAGADALANVAGDPAPDRVVAGRELLRELRARLTAEERELADRRADGQEWAAIAAALGGTADGRRKQLARAIRRIAPEIGLDVDDGD